MTRIFLLLGAAFLFAATPAQAQGPSAAYLGFSAAAHNKYKTAIVFYTAALRNPHLPKEERASLQDKRGVAYASIGETRQAIEDFGAVIRLEPHYLFAYFNRGAALAKEGRYQAALADFDTIIKYDPGSGAAYFYRGQTEFEARRFGAAVADFAHDVRLVPADGLASVWLYLADGRAGRAHDASALAKAATAIDTTQWPGPVVAYYLGRMTPAQLLTAAASPNTDVQADHQCQANFYMGEDALQHHLAADAKRFLSQAATHCPIMLAERTAAMIELKHLR